MQYVDQDVMFRETEPAEDPSVFSWLVAGNSTRLYNNETMAGETLVKVKLNDGPVTTTSMVNITMGIPVCATEPEGAARLMNLLYTDADVKNLVNYGLEGENYTFADNGGVVVDNNSGYAPGNSNLFGNMFLDYPLESVAAAGLDEAPDQNGLPYSPLLRFSADLSNVSTEVAQLSSVVQEYAPALRCGMADEETYQEMLDKMYASGLQKYLDEIQSQLDEWLAQQ